MDFKPTLKVDGEFYFRLRCNLGTAGLHAHLIELYLAGANVDRVIVDHTQSSFTVDEFKEALDEVDFTDEIFIIAMGPNDEVQDLHYVGEE